MKFRKTLILCLALSALASRFRLTPGQIDEAMAGAFNRAAWRAATGAPASEMVVDDLFAAARAQSGHELATLARKIEPMTTTRLSSPKSWHRLVLPDDVTAQLHELVERAAMPVFALGGMTRHDANHARAVGAQGIASIRARRVAISARCRWAWWCSWWWRGP